MTRAISIFLTLLLLLLASCEKPKPVATGLPNRPRIVALSPAIGVILTDLQFEHLCVGRHGFDKVLHPSIPVVGTQTEIDYEAVIQSHPTHILTQWGSQELPPRLVELSKTNGWKLIDSRLLTLEDIRETTIGLDKELCAATGIAAPSAAAVRALARMDAAWTARPPGKGGFAGIGRVLLLDSAAPPAAYGPGSCHYQLLGRLGVTPAITRGSPYIQLDSEDILRIAPDAIILIAPRAFGTPPPTSEEAENLRRTTFAALAALDIPAAKSARFAIIDDPLGQIPSTAMIGLAEELASVLEDFR